ncbi:hypothetical protein [Sphingobium estronivorans]|uniref:hypothetical protein n=1 Tax=Sphingobium estronivorans TaxID=1577690 RepID=UPI001F083BCD|nr:hypothetical protein [Sphingobium estronivorans]
MPMMRRYPSHQSVPSIIHERVFFGLWIAMSALMILAYGIELERHVGQTHNILSSMGIGLLWCVPFGIVGLLLRRRRLKKLAERQAFLSSLAEQK